MYVRLIVSTACLALLVVACGSPTAPATPTRGLDPSRPAYAALTGTAGADQGGSCSFDRGTTTCVTTEQHTETGTHVEYSGCVAGPPPNFRPGSRARTFSDTWQLTVTTTTLYRGRSDHPYDSSSSTSRVLLSSVLVSDVCQPI